MKKLFIVIIALIIINVFAVETKTSPLQLEDQIKLLKNGIIQLKKPKIEWGVMVAGFISGLLSFERFKNYSDLKKIGIKNNGIKNRGIIYLSISLLSLRSWINTLVKYDLYLDKHQKGKKQKENKKE